MKRGSKDNRNSKAVDAAKTEATGAWEAGGG